MPSVITAPLALVNKATYAFLNGKEFIQKRLRMRGYLPIDMAMPVTSPQNVKQFSFFHFADNQDRLTQEPKSIVEAQTPSVNRVPSLALQ